MKLGLRLRELRGVRLRAGRGVFVNDTRLGSAIHCRSVGDRRSLRIFCFAGLDRSIELLVERLQTGFDRFIASGQTRRLACGFDSRFSIGHAGNVVKLVKNSKLDL